MPSKVVPPKKCENPNVALRQRLRRRGGRLPFDEVYGEWVAYLLYDSVLTHIFATLVNLVCPKRTFVQAADGQDHGGEGQGSLSEGRARRRRVAHEEGRV